MEKFYSAILGGLLAGLSAWGAQTLGAPHWGAAMSAAIGGFLGATIGQKLAH